MNIIQEIEQEHLAEIAGDKAIPDFSAGDTVRVNVRVVEGNRERVQAFEGVCIARRNAGLNSSFTVRKLSYGEGRRTRLSALQPAGRIDRDYPPRQGPPGQALLSARPDRQAGPYRRADDRPRHEEGRGGRGSRRKRGSARTCRGSGEAETSPRGRRPRPLRNPTLRQKRRRLQRKTLRLQRRPERHAAESGGCRGSRGGGRNDRGGGRNGVCRRRRHGGEGRLIESGAVPRRATAAIAADGGTENRTGRPSDDPTPNALRQDLAEPPGA